jgi:hypothetical protein
MTSRMLLSALRSRTRYALATCLARPSSQLHVCNSSQAIHSSMDCSLSKTSQRQNAMMVLMGEPVSALGAPLNAASSTHLMTWRKGSLRYFVRSRWPALYRESGVFDPQIAKWKGSPSQAANWSSIISGASVCCLNDAGFQPFHLQVFNYCRLCRLWALFCQILLLKSYAYRSIQVSNS